MDFNETLRDFLVTDDIVHLLFHILMQMMFGVSHIIQLTRLFQL